MTEHLSKPAVPYGQELGPATEIPIPPDEEVAEIGRLSLGQLIWRRFLHSKLGVVGGLILILFYVTITFADFVAPSNHLNVNADYILRKPQGIHFFDEAGQFHLQPFVYGTTTTLDTDRLEYVHEDDPSQIYPIKFLVRGSPYKMWGLIESDRHLFGVDEPGTIFVFGTDRLGRDVLSRVIFGGRISLTVGLVGVTLTIIFGSTLGTISGYFGGRTDVIMQRGIELLMSFPTIALWAALAAALPPDWSTVKRFFAISIILSLIGWTGLARQVRAKVLSYREMDYTDAARAAGASHRRIIFIHMLPNALSHIIVIATLSIPNMILAETALSFLGLGIQPPSVSWGTLLQDAQTVSVVVLQPWIMIPGIFVIITVLCFNFVGDGLRDAADPFAI